MEWRPRRAIGSETCQDEFVLYVSAMEATLATRQRTVKIGVGIGVLGMATIVVTVLALVPLRDVPPLADRLAFAAQCAVFPALMLALGIGAVGSARFKGEAMNPLEPKEVGSALLVHQRYLQNTLEQLVLHLVVLFGVAADGTALGMRLLPALAACFVVGRGAFWIGYLRDPMKRSPGFAMTMHPTLVGLVYLAVRAGAHALGVTW
jgi:hypothetical protein